MAKQNKTKNTLTDHPIREFSADIAPVYNDTKKRTFTKQGRRSFLDEFHTLYRKWIKNE